MCQVTFTRGTSTDFKNNTVSDCINLDAKISLRNRQPIVGKIVAMDDFQELLTKGMFRFCSKANEEYFNREPHIIYTRIFSIDEITEIKTYSIEKI